MLLKLYFNLIQKELSLEFFFYELCVKSLIWIIIVLLHKLTLKSWFKFEKRGNYLMKDNTTFVINNYCVCTHTLYVRGNFDKYFWVKKSVNYEGRVVEEKFVFDYQKFVRGFV